MRPARRARWPPRCGKRRGDGRRGIQWRENRTSVVIGNVRQGRVNDDISILACNIGKKPGSTEKCASCPATQLIAGNFCIIVDSRE